MIGIVPAAGSASRMQPLGGSKELLPLGLATTEPGGRRLKAVSEYLLERMVTAGAERICLVVSSEKADLLRFYAQSELAARVFFVVQPRPLGLCDAIFRAAPFVGSEETVLIGLPDTIWFPINAFGASPRDRIHLITFPVPNPEEFDAVIPAAPESSLAARIEVKRPGNPQRRVWGAMTAPAPAYRRLRLLWLERGGQDQYLGDLLNAWIGDGGEVGFDRNGKVYWDIGTPAGYERALRERLWAAGEPASLRRAG